jgi:hypothetical protein
VAGATNSAATLTGAATGHTHGPAGESALANTGDAPSISISISIDITVAIAAAPRRAARTRPRARRSPSSNNRFMRPTIARIAP